MKKNYFLLICLFCSLLGYSQKADIPHISQKFQIDTSFVLDHYTPDFQNVTLFSTIYNDVFYFCSNRSFQVQEREFSARIYGIDLNTKKQFFFDVPFPTKGKEIYAREAKTQWLTDMDFSENQLILIGDATLFIYNKVAENQYEYVNKGYFKNLQQGYFYNNDFYGVHLDHDKGYSLYKYDLSKKKKKKVQDFLFDAPFLNQFKPHQYFTVDEHNIYFSKMCNLGYSRYTLDGKFVDSVAFSVEGWTPIPDKYIKTSQKLSYGPSRIMYGYQVIGNYHRNSGFYPFSTGQQWAFYYSPKDSLYFLGIPKTAFAQYDKFCHSWDFKEYQYKIEDDVILSDSVFPMYFRPATQSLQIACRDMVIEISSDADVSMNGKTYAAYTAEKDLYFRDHDPIYKMRFLKVKHEETTINIDSLILYDYDNQRVATETLKPYNKLFVFNKSLQCSGCLKVLLSYLNSFTIQDSNKVALVFEGFTDYLSKRQNAKSVAEFFQQPYTPFYTRMNESGTQLMQQMYNNLGFPIVAIWDAKTEKLRLFDLDDIFTEDMVKYEFRESFIKTIEEFFRK